MKILFLPAFLLATSTCTQCINISKNYDTRCAIASRSILPLAHTEALKSALCIDGARSVDVYKNKNVGVHEKVAKKPYYTQLPSGRLESCGAQKYVLCFLTSKKQECHPSHSQTGYKKGYLRHRYRNYVLSKDGSTGELRERILIVDGTGLAYRCFFALPTLTTYRGTEIGALVGFMNSIARLYKTIGPKYCCVVFDSPGANNSKREVWPEYKTNRQVIKTSFKKQLMWIKEFCTIIGLPLFIHRTTEADDIISSMVNFLRGSNIETDKDVSPDEKPQKMRSIEFKVPDQTKGGVFDKVSGRSNLPLEPIQHENGSGIDHMKFDVYILTADKDLLQILEQNESGNVNVRIVQPHKKFRHVDEEVVRAEYGIPPERFSEYLALVGDSADNIPGVLGIGPKTAPILISKYPSFKDIIKSEEITKIAKKGGKYSLSVEKAYDFHLITKLKSDLPILTSMSQLLKKRTLEIQFLEFCKLFSLQKCSQRWQDVTH